MSSLPDWWYAPYGRSGVSLYAYPDGLQVDGWYDTIVGLEPGFITWLRKKAKRRKPYRGRKHERDS